MTRILLAWLIRQLEAFDDSLVALDNDVSSA